MRIRLKHARLATLLAASPLSQNHWAIRLGLSRGHFSDIVNGKHPYVSAKTRTRLLEVLGVPFDELFEIEVPASEARGRVVTAAPSAPVLSVRSASGGFMSAITGDLQHAWRLATRHRVTSLAIVATLALTIGVTSAVFSVVNGVLLKPLPFDASDRVVRLSTVFEGGTSTIMNAQPELDDYRKASTVSDVTGVFLSGATLTEGEAPQQHLILYVDHGYDDVFRLRPEAGRFFVPDEYRPDAPKVVLLGHDLWQQQFGGDRGLVGRAISINNEPVTVVGILPPLPYVYPSFPDVGFIEPLRPIPGSYQEKRGGVWLRAAARMKPGVTLPQAQAELAGIAARMSAAFPDVSGGRSVRVEQLHEVETRDARAVLGLLSGAVVTVMLIACVNVANLLLGQAETRTSEFAVRAALGGSGARLRRQILTETVSLASIGGSIGLAFTPILTRALIASYPDTLPRVAPIGVDARVIAVGVACALGAGLLAGIPLARRASSRSLSSDLRQGGRASSARGRQRVGRLLIASQVALSLSLLFAAGLLIRTFLTLQSTDAGFRSAGIATFFVTPPSARYPTKADIQRYFDSARAALEQVPGVADIANASEMPLTGNANWTGFVIHGAADRGSDNPQDRAATVSSNYRNVLQVPLKAGRIFSEIDRATAPPVVIVNDVLAAKFFPGGNPVGRSVAVGARIYEIVGVVGSMRMVSMTEPPEPQLYFSSDQDLQRGRYFILRSSGSVAPAVVDIRRALRGVDATIAVTEAVSMSERVFEAMAPHRYRATLILVLGTLALVLSALGIYGVMADAVSRQTREIGIRLALGEDQSRLQRRVIWSAITVVAAGVAAGCGLALAAGRALAGFLVGVQPNDPVTLLLAVAILVAIGSVAALVPARRASRVDPLVALRQE